MNNVEQLVTQLCELAIIHITKQKGGWFVAVHPTGKTPLWWWANKPTLQEALQEVLNEAVKLGLCQKEV